MNTIAVLLGLAVLVAFYLLYQGHEKRISKLEDAQKKGVNYRTLEDMEHGMAELAVHETEVDMRYHIEKGRINNIREYLSKAHTPTKRKRQEK